MQLNKRETALILAGLRLLQDHWQNAKSLPNGLEEILDSANVREVPLARIDRLCEKINTNEDGNPAIDALAKCFDALGNWVEIQSEGDERASDQEALTAAAEVLRAAGRLE